MLSTSRERRSPGWTILPVRSEGAHLPDVDRARRTASAALARQHVGNHEQAATPIRPPSTSALLTEAVAHLKCSMILTRILVDQSHRVVHMSENAGRFLQPAGGPLSGNVVDLVRPELRYELRSALRLEF